MIRSTKTTLKFTNQSKILLINNFIQNYKLLCEQFIELLWELPKVPSLVPKEITKLVKTDLSARIIQCAAKQASRNCSWN